jgi:hypothetical protein
MHVESVLPRDAIPSVDAPEFGPSYFGDPGDEVVVVDADPPRAYPIRLLSYHEVVNDVLDASGDRTPIAVTWCPICWSAVVYDRTVTGRTLEFGVSGKLADDALVMYDRQTDSEWKQTTGEAIAGDLEGAKLDVLPASLISYEAFRDGNPDGVVLQPAQGRDGTQSPRTHYDMEPYERYAESEPFGLYGMRGEGRQRSWDRDDLDPKAVVLGVEAGGEAVGYPVERVEAAGGVVTDTVGGLSVVVLAGDGGVHAFEDPGSAFERRDGDVVADGATWDPATGQASDGRRLDPVPSRRLFAFAWQDAHGEDAFYG